MTLRFAPASTLERPTLARLFNDAYSGYEVPTHMDEEALAFMVRLVDIDLDRSVVAWDGDRLAAMAMLALRGASAWIGGMGVVPDARGRGYGRDVMRAAIAGARDAGARCVDLEVLEGNASAIHIYEALGFAHTRRLVVWRVEPGGDFVRETPRVELTELDPGAALDLADRWQAAPPWQRARATIANLPEPPRALAAGAGEAPTGVVVFRAVPERVSVVALGAAGQHPATLEALLGGVLARHPDAMLRLLNLPAGDPAEAPIERLGAKAEARQFEMRLDL